MSEPKNPDGSSPLDRLIRRKEEAAKTGRHWTGGGDARPRRRLPPGQHKTIKWPVLDLGNQPNIAPKDWTFSVAGHVTHPIKWTWNDFMAQPQETVTSDIHCVTAWSRFDNLWQGVSARHFLDVVKPKPTAKFLIFHGYDGYTTNVPIEHFAASDTIVVHSWNGAPLTREHGGPVRVVIPHLYFWKSTKWLKYVLFNDNEVPGYWEVRGYNAVGDPWREERYG